MGALGIAAGCGSTTSLEIKAVAVATQAPSNVAVHLKVTQPEGATATLLASDFVVEEDGKAIPTKKLRRALLPSSLVVDRYVMLVVDLSGPLVDSEYLSTFHDVVASFSERAGLDSRFALYAFDGDGLKPFIGFDATELKPGLSGMRKYRPHNRTVDIYGAYIAALDELDAAAKGSTAAEHTSTLVFVTDRRDKAGKHTLDEANNRLQASPADVYVLGLGDAINREELTRLGRPDAFFVEKFRDLGKPFNQAADRIEAKRNEDYVFSYCSLAKSKKGTKHDLEIEIESKKWSGSTSTKFSSKGFTKGACDPRERVSFGGGRDDGASEGGGGDDGSGGAKKSKKKKRRTDEEQAEGE
ncbi:MAG TPA: vWA domain-containing protein, partial [Polyangia bacterium]